MERKHFKKQIYKKLCEDVAVYNHQIEKGDNVFEIVNEAIRTAYEQKGVAVVICPDNINCGTLSILASYIPFNKMKDRKSVV